jgi:hypothetical protein
MCFVKGYFIKVLANKAKYIYTSIPITTIANKIDVDPEDSHPESLGFPVCFE